MPDLYSLLGVPKSATADEIKSAYRKLAKKLHPDVNPGKKDVEQKFKEITAAYDLLSDPAKRARYDRGEIDDQGQEKGFGGGYGGQYRQQRSGPQGDPFAHFGGAEGFEDIFAEFMGGGKRGQRGRGPQKGNDVAYTLNVSFIDATKGGKQRVTMNGGKTVDITIPPGTEDGHKLRLRGQGEEAKGGAGDAIIEIKVVPHPHFTRKGQDITLEAPISLPEAVLGGSINIPTLDGIVALKVPSGANTGTQLRLKGKGVPASKTTPAGDMFVKLKVVLPDAVDETLHDAVEKWAKKHAYDPRKKLGW